MGDKTKYVCLDCNVTEEIEDCGEDWLFEHWGHNIVVSTNFDEPFRVSRREEKESDDCEYLTNGDCKVYWACPYMKRTCKLKNIKDGHSLGSAGISVDYVDYKCMICDEWNNGCKLSKCKNGVYENRTSVQQWLKILDTEKLESWMIPRRVESRREWYRDWKRKSEFR